MKIPYGLSNFADLRRSGCLYIDKTPFLPILESRELGYAYLLFLRPRRMGKSLLLSMMEHYYDVGRSEEFDELFGGLWVHEHPTTERNRYLVLTLDFSSMSTGGSQDDLQQSFVNAVKNSVRRFLVRYRARVPDLSRIEPLLDSYRDAAALIGNLLAIIAGTGDKMYLFIDEYDGFADRLVSASASDPYKSFTQLTNVVRQFYAALTSATQTGALQRTFITGTSPVLREALSSGFNVTADVSRSPQLHALTGFTAAEVKHLVDRFLADRIDLTAQTGITNSADLLDTLHKYYGGYRFSEDAHEHVTSSDMIVQFLKETDNRGLFPTEILDFNARVDYQRLLRLRRITRADLTAQRALLNAILSNTHLHGMLTHYFGAESLSSSREQLVSLTYHLGMLTLGDQPLTVQGHRLEIPNQMIRKELTEILNASTSLARKSAQMKQTRPAVTKRLGARRVMNER